MFGGSENSKSRRDKLRDTVDPCNYYECCTPKHIIDDIDGLKADLQKRLFGQHIVNSTLIQTLRAHINNIESSEKPLVMSFHGTMGTGKNHVTDLIIKNFYKYGENSKYVHRYRARKDFPVDSEVEIYRVSEEFYPFWPKIVKILASYEKLVLFEKKITKLIFLPFVMKKKTDQRVKFYWQKKIECNFDRICLYFRMDFFLI